MHQRPQGEPAYAERRTLRRGQRCSREGHAAEDGAPPGLRRRDTAYDYGDGVNRAMRGRLWVDRRLRVVANTKTTSRADGTELPCSSPFVPPACTLAPAGGTDTPTRHPPAAAARIRDG